MTPDMYSGTSCVYLDPWNEPTGSNTYGRSVYWPDYKEKAPVKKTKEKPWHKFTKRRMDGRFKG